MMFFIFTIKVGNVIAYKYKVLQLKFMKKWNENCWVIAKL